MPRYHLNTQSNQYAFAEEADLFGSASYFIMYCDLDVEEEVHDVAVLNDILLTFDSELSCSPTSRLRFELDEILIFDDFGANKAFLEV